MKELVDLRSNPSLVPVNGRLDGAAELILVLHEKRYALDFAGRVDTVPHVETVRFTVAGAANLRALGQVLLEVADDLDAQLDQLQPAAAAEQPPAEKPRRARVPIRRDPNRPEATLDKTLNGHKLFGEKHGGRWTLVCPSWPDLAAAHAGCADASDCVDEFERRATVKGSAA